MGNQLICLSRDGKLAKRALRHTLLSGRLSRPRAHLELGGINLPKMCVEFNLIEFNLVKTL